MKQRFLPLLRSLSVFIAAFTAFTCGAEKIDNTHYRFCVMDDAEITDYATLSAENSNQLPTIADANWYGYNGIELKAHTNYLTQNFTTDVPVLMTDIYSGDKASIVHKWGKAFNGVIYKQYTYFYITVQAPSGVSLGYIPEKFLVGDKISFKTNLDGTFPSFSGNGYFSYNYSSSDKNTATVSAHDYSSPFGIIKAINPGKATITVKVYANNSKYVESYYIGEATAEIEVVDNLDPNDISLSSRELSLDMGQQETLTATLTPEDARTDITWSSSDESVATVEDGLIKAVGRGNAAIEARTSNGLSAKCYVTVLGDQDYSGVCVDGLYYDLDRKEHTAAVVHENPDNINYSYISGEIIVPGKIQCYGADYTVTRINDCAFFKCEITSVKLPETITSIGFWAFSNSKLEDIELPKGLKEIGSLAFSSTNLESIIIGPNVSLLGDGAFADCLNLKAVYVDEANPYYVIYKYCLYNAAKTKLYYVPIGNTAVKFPSGLETIGSLAFYNNKEISSIQFPENLINIEAGAFSGCESFEKLSFPNALMEIGDFAFQECNNLKEIEFGSKLKMIGEDAFDSYPTSLKIVRISALNPPTAYENSFRDYGAALVVPLGRVSAYKKDSVWGKFATITDDENDPALGVESLRDNDIAKTHPDVYDLNGVLLIQGATKEEIRSLPAGVYLIGDKKIVIR